MKCVILDEEYRSQQSDLNKNFGGVRSLHRPGGGGPFGTGSDTTYFFRPQAELEFKVTREPVTTHDDIKLCNVRLNS
jgi:hypothetical protein